MCPKDFVSNRKINNIFEEASPLRDKLMFIAQFADGTSAEFRVPEGRQPLDWGAAESAAASEGVASERSETRSPEPRVWYKY